MPDENPAPPWLEENALVPVPPDAGPWGVAWTHEEDVEYESLADKEALRTRLFADDALFAWTPGDKHVRTVYEIDALAHDVAARGRIEAEHDRKRSRLPLAAFIAAAIAAVVFWPSDRELRVLAVLAVIVLLVPLWRRGVERAFDAWRDLRLLATAPDRWRDDHARRLRFTAWSGLSVSLTGVVLIGVFVVTFGVMRWAGSRDAVAALGLVKPAVRAGEWWRLWTCALLHGSVMHLFFNCTAGVALANLARSLVDEARILLVFVVAVGTGSLASTFATDAPSIGASGGLLGWGGMLYGLAATHPGLRRCGIASNMARWVVLLALIGAAGASFIDNAAHAGGFLGGLVLGVGFARGAPPLPLWRTPSRAVWTMILGGAAAAWLWALATLVRL